MTNHKNPHTNNDDTHIIINQYLAAFSDDQITAIGNANLLESLHRFFIDMHQHQTARHALELVEITSQFMNETDPDFKDMRDHNIDDHHVIERFNRIASEIDTCVQDCKKFSATAEEKRLLNHVISLCIRCMRGRIDALTTTDQRMHELFMHTPNQLRDLLEKSDPSTHKS